ncbi:hypothetical protein P2G88_01500 [Aliiglaciecola sp. CAU 1673]|uniref:hypothetical protein n=1 Tax=Aliiglaciecola sp. CAU 1673 TaxID=3032595 RepID=UPI0023DA2B52|nr:hypothetical protein [Aliiglaciecola sp. CAU 1673]MDF2176927.1 hypothetical protein [Aliiglaciecola sp. CAU 1673]
MELKQFVFITSITALTACGGGSSGDKQTTPANGGGNSVTPPSAAPKLILETVQYNYCDIESPLAGAEVLIHDAQGSIVKSVQTDSLGKLQTDWPANAAHVSVIGQGSSGNRGRTAIESLLNTGAMDLGVIKFANTNDHSGCDCRTITLNAGDLAATFDGYEMKAAQRFAWLSSYTELNVEVCSSDEYVDVTLKSETFREAFAAKVPVGQEDTIYLRKEHFTSTGIPIEAAVSGVIEPDYRTDWFSFSFDGRSPQWSLVDSEPYFATDLYVFPEMSNQNFLQYSVLKTEYLEDMEIRVYSTVLRRVPSNGQAGFFEAIYPGQEFLDSFVQLLEGMDTGNTTTYDFSSTDEDLDRFSIYVNADEANGDEIYWRITAPVSGVMPDLKLQDSLENRFENADFSRVRFYLSDYGHSDYEEYLKGAVTASRANSWYEAGMMDNFKGIYLNIRLN